MKNDKWIVLGIFILVLYCFIILFFDNYNSKLSNIMSFEFDGIVLGKKYESPDKVLVLKIGIDTICLTLPHNDISSNYYELCEMGDRIKKNGRKLILVKMNSKTKHVYEYPNREIFYSLENTSYKPRNCRN